VRFVVSVRNSESSPPTTHRPDVRKSTLSRGLTGFPARGLEQSPTSRSAGDQAPAPGLIIKVSRAGIGYVFGTGRAIFEANLVSRRGRGRPTETGRGPGGDRRMRRNRISGGFPAGAFGSGDDPDHRPRLRRAQQSAAANAIR